MADFLIPDRYVPNVANSTDMNIASIAFGVSLGVCIFTFAKASQQSIRSWKRSTRSSQYLMLVWTEWIASTVMSAISWCYLRTYITPGFPYFFSVVFLWAVQIQALIQIIINRIAILMVNRQNAAKLKWSFFAGLLVINMSVFVCWIPARLQISDTWVQVNNIWDRIEKVIFLLMDASLNIYFIHLVRTRLIANGLTKYNRLFRFNLAMIAVSMTMDVLLIAMMSLPNDIVYIQFHPLAYLVKLHIEMNMAELITKVVKSTNPSGYDYSGSRSLPTQPNKSTSRGQNTTNKHVPSMFGNGNTTYIEAGGDDEIELPTRDVHGIQKTTTTQIVVKTSAQSDYDDHDVASESSSTRHLKRENYRM